MGQYWEIVCTGKDSEGNVRKEHFCAHPFGSGKKLWEFFTNKDMIDALLYLITITDEKDDLAGRWAGMNVTIVGDGGDDEDHYPCKENGWVDIGDELSKKVFSDDGVPKDGIWRVTCKHEKEEFVTMIAGDPLLFYLITNRKDNELGGLEVDDDGDDGLYFGRWSCFPHSISAIVTKKHRREQRRREDGDITTEANKAKEYALDINYSAHGVDP